MGLGKAIGRTTLARIGYFFERAEKTGPVRHFLETIRPVETEHALLRYGSEFDGGYLVPDDLAGIAACFSPGVQDNASFELQVAERGIPCFLADYSVDTSPADHPLIDFQRSFIGASRTGIYTTLNDWVAEKAPEDGDLLLQMDIEGAEYEALLATDPEVLARFRIMVVEFHGLDGVFSKRVLPIIEATFRKILPHFHIVHIHPNNCLPEVRYRDCDIPPVMEFTFLRKDRAQEVTPATTFPHPLDQPNRPGNPDVTLPALWLRQGDAQKAM